MEIDNHNHKQTGQGEVSQANTSESISNSLPPPDLAHLIDQLEIQKDDSERMLKFIRRHFSKDSSMAFFLNGRLEIINYVLTSLSIED